MSILDKHALEKRSCECYRFIRKPHERLYGVIRRLLASK